ncbi:hypothetical protein TDB9533_04544 [Thalassocella blandensis]|nr:hypothetical protein TDB9533_04544 [Thalassocella blandensis]
MSNIYAAPDAELTQDVAGSEFSTLEKGIAGDYTLNYRDVLAEAWHKVQGAKGTIWLAVLLFFITNLAVGFSSGFILTMAIGASFPLASALLSQVLVIAITTPLTAGLMIIAIRRAADSSIRATSIFDYYGKIVPLFFTMLLLYLMLTLGFLLFVLPGIYLSIAYVFAMPLVVEKNLSPWQALEASRKAVTKRWFTIFAIFITVMFVFAISSLPLFIGLIWAIPWMSITMGILYRNIFGVENSTIETE